MERLYIYNNSTRKVVAVVSGKDNTCCERIAAERFSDTDYFGWTYSPAFGTRDGLIETDNYEAIEA